MSSCANVGYFDVRHRQRQSERRDVRGFRDRPTAPIARVQAARRPPLARLAGADGLLFVVYYGYIILVATNKALLGRRIGEVTTLAIPLGAAVIIGAWVLTALYVIWANRQYDPHVQTLRERLTQRK